MKQVRFFAVDDDLIIVLDEVEKSSDLQYVKAGLFSTPSTENYTKGATLPRLGLATEESGIDSESFLVADRTSIIRSRSIELQNKTTNFCIDQLDNPETVVLTPSGNWRDIAILYGTVGTASDTESSVKLIKTFEKAFKKHFKKVKAYWVGPRALALLHQGKRLTIAIQSPKDFDLTLD